MSLNWLLLSDLIIIPTNDAMRSFKGILDLRDNLNVICRQEKRNIPDIKIIFNNIKENVKTATILN
jgi:chromosome partitioning protein